MPWTILGACQALAVVSLAAWNPSAKATTVDSARNADASVALRDGEGDAVEKFHFALVRQMVEDSRGKQTAEQSIKAWDDLRARYSATGHPETAEYLDLLAQVDEKLRMLRDNVSAVQRHLALEAKRQAEALEEQKLAGAWLKETEAKWTAVQAKCADSSLSAYVKRDEIEAFKTLLAKPPAGQRDRAGEWIAWATKAAGEANDAIEKETPSEPLKLAALLADSPVTDEPEPVQRAFVYLAQRKLIDLKVCDFEPDGLFGPASHRALVDFQKSKRLVANARFDASTLAALKLDHPDSEELRTLSAQFVPAKPKPKPEQEVAVNKPANPHRDIDEPAKKVAAAPPKNEAAGKGKPAKELGVGGKVIGGFKEGGNIIKGMFREWMRE